MASPQYRNRQELSSLPAISFPARRGSLLRWQHSERINGLQGQLHRRACSGNCFRWFPLCFWYGLRGRELVPLTTPLLFASAFAILYAASFAFARLCRSRLFVSLGRFFLSRWRFGRLIPSVFSYCFCSACQLRIHPPYLGRCASWAKG